jgi:hypothetical protein
LEYLERIKYPSNKRFVSDVHACARAPRPVGRKPAASLGFEARNVGAPRLGLALSLAERDALTALLIKAKAARDNSASGDDPVMTTRQAGKSLTLQGVPESTVT